MNKTTAHILLFLLAAVIVATPAAEQRTALPAKLESFLNSAGALSRGERSRLVAGQAVTTLLDGDDSKEVAVLGAVWIDAPMRRYVEAVNDIERFESGGGFKVTKRISEPPQPGDFGALRPSR